MYRLEDLKKVGWINVGGGLATLLTGIVIQTLVGLPFDKVVADNFIFYVLFAVGWFLFNQIVMATVYNKLANQAGRDKLTRLAAPLKNGPGGRWGQSYVRIEIMLMVVWVLSVVVIQSLLGQNLTQPIGGFAGGWLVGGGLGRLRFTGKLRQEEAEQQRRFYFSDAALGPRTDVTFYSENPEELLPVASPDSPLRPALNQASLPPGVKRRAQAITGQDQK